MKSQSDGRKLLVVLAHPDDEMGFSSALAHYALRGVDIEILALTSGQKGFRSHTSISSVEELVAVRKEELRRSCETLGLSPPIFLDFVDQELFGSCHEDVRREMARVIRQLEPDVVLTFGPDGITGHPDHRAASCYTTDLLQEMGPPHPLLFYLALSTRHAEAFRRSTGRKLLAVSESYITTRLHTSDQEVELAARAISHYRSQFDEETLQQMIETFRSTLRVVSFREAFLGDPSPKRGLFP